MDQERMYRQQLRRQLERKKKRRIRRIKVYLCRTVVVCFFGLTITGMIKVAGVIYNKMEEKGKPFQKEDVEAFAQAASPEIVSYSVDQLVRMGYDKTLAESLQELSEDNEAAAQILSHIEDYPEELLELLVKNEETADFVKDYPEDSQQAEIRGNVDISDLYAPGSIPLFLQWDKRWGYCKYGNNYIALSGCGPTCLSMVYVGLTGDVSKNPGVVSAFSEELGFLDPDNNTMWALMSDGAQALGLISNEISLDENTMIEELDKGRPLILSMRPGDFTTGGHFIVITGYKKGKFVVHDPNSIIRSKKLWDFETLAPQVKNLWSFSI